MPTLQEVFGEPGILQRAFSAYEFRPQQLHMAERVRQVIEQGGCLACEAPCGVGKTFAYLVPAIVRAAEHECRVVVCTANIALQEQLVKKDVPFLQKALGMPFEYRLIKGLSNYLCLDRYNEARKELRDLFCSQWPELREWARVTRTGDRSEIPFEPDPGLWWRISGIGDLCNGPQCYYFKDCHAMNARRALASAQLIICNYHLLFSDLKLRAAGGSGILPDYDVLVCDEAHEMADAAREIFGARLTMATFLSIVRSARTLRMTSACEHLRAAAQRFFDRIGEPRRLTGPGEVAADDLQAALRDFRELLQVRAESVSDERKLDKIRKLAAAAAGLAATLQEFADLSDDNKVYWISRSEEGHLQLNSALIQAGPVLKELLFDHVRAVVLTSATLRTSGSFRFFKSEVGLQQAAEVVVDSPFDFRRQAALIVPEMRCDPRDGEFAAEASEIINRVIRALGGRTMVLCTSYRNLNAFADAARSTGVKVLRQGDKPRTQLLEEFRSSLDCVLFATASFWQGVDIPGEALSCLIIDKLPFAPPDDPLTQAMEERDPNWFHNWSLPRALLRLKQGFGRLIRTRSDRGVVLLLDVRAAESAYARDVRASLPDCPLHRSLEALFEFFGIAPV